MASMSNNMKMMVGICNGLHLDMDKVNELSKNVLEMYKYYAWSEYEKNIREDLIDGVGGGSSDIAWLWLNTFATSAERKIYRNCIKDIKSARMLKDMTMAAIGVVSKFPNGGSEYKAILEECFLKDDKDIQERIADKMNIADSTFRRKKKEAILLFGIALCNDKQIMNGVMKAAYL